MALERDISTQGHFATYTQPAESLPVKSYS